MILCLTSYALTDTNHEWLFILQFNNVGMCQILWCPKKHIDFMLRSLSNSEQHPVSIRQCELTLSPTQGSLVIHSSTMSK